MSTTYNNDQYYSQLASPLVLGLTDHVSDNIPNGGRAFDANPELTFNVVLGATITLSENGRVIVATSVPMTWTLPTLADGSHYLSLTQTTPAGQSSYPSYLSLSVDAAHSPLNIPVTPVFLGLTDHSMGNVGSSGISHDANPVL